MVAQPVRTQHVLVASVHDLATDAGLEILKKGGNAVDAAVAVGFALAVVHPEAGNLGGSGFALVRLATGKTAAFDYIGEAPTGSRPEMFTNPREAQTGYKSAIVPGTVAGLGLMHQRYGRLNWSDCLAPARRLARNGFPASLRLELILKLQVPVMKPYAETAKVFLHGSDQPLRQNDLVRQRDLGETIGRIQKKGWLEFYQGETARLIAADMAANGGFISAHDLYTYEARELEPLRITYRGYPVILMPPSSTGGLALGVMLNVLGRYELQLGREGSVTARHLQIEAMRRGFQSRARVIAGGFSTISEVLSDDYTTRLVSGLALDHATAPLPAGADSTESPDTTHFTVIDAEGNVVTNTYTLSGFFGSQVIARGTGVLLNNHMSAFQSAVSRKSLKPGARYHSTMSPVIVLRPGGSVLCALGTPGAATIPSTLFQVISNLVDFKMSLRDAIEFPRIHASAGPVDAEPAAMVYDVAEQLRRMGHALNSSLRSQGDVSAIMVEESTGWRLGWADGRRGGAVKGY